VVVNLEIYIGVRKVQRLQHHYNSIVACVANRALADKKQSA